jgi:hypothetical protein
MFYLYTIGSAMINWRQIQRYIQALMVCVLIIIAPASKAQDDTATSAIQDFLLKNVETLVSSLGSWGVSTIEFGAGDGFIFKGIASIGRTVQRNENTTKKEDMFLVKDELKIGIRLGVGMAVSGDVSFVRKYTLIYPAESRLKGAFKNKFLVNLILPYQVHAQKLPEKYVLMVEDSVEGRGRLKLGLNVMIPIGIEGSASAIKLARFFTAKQSEDHMVFFDDQANMFKLSAQIYLHLQFFDLPFAESYLARGKNKRQILHVNLKNVSPERLKVAFKHFVKHGSLYDFESMGEYQQLSGKFIETHHKFELPFLLEWIKVSRRDRFHLDDHDDAEKSGDYMNIYNYHRRFWWLPATGESKWEHINLTLKEGEKKTNILANGKTIEVRDYRPVMAHITLRINDVRTSQNELKESYLPIFNQTSVNPEFIKLPAIPGGNHTNWGRTTHWMDFYLFEDALTKLESLNESEYWRLVALATGDSQYADIKVVSIIEKNKIQYRQRWRVIRPFWKAWKSLMKAQKKEEIGNEGRQAIWLNRALNSLVRKGRIEYRPLYLRLLRIIAESVKPSAPDYFLHGRVVVPENRLLKGYHGAIMLNNEGTDRRNEVFQTPFVFYDLQQIWSLFI